MPYAALIVLAVSTGAEGSVVSVNSAIMQWRVFDDVPAATVTEVNNYPSSISFEEQGVSSQTGFANRDVWYFSNNGRASAYQFQTNDYFNASFGVTLTGGRTGIDVEAGFLFSDPRGGFGGDLQSIVNAAGAVVEFGGPSYYPFSPAAGGFPGAGGSVPSYVEGQTYIMELDYVIDPNTGQNAFQYSVNGQFAASSPGNPYFDLSPGQFIGSAGDTLGGYFQIQNDPSNPTNSGTAIFTNISITAVPEPSVVAIISMGIPALVRRRGAARQMQKTTSK
jgi:hypothetical protein